MKSNLIRATFALASAGSLMIAGATGAGALDGGRVPVESKASAPGEVVISQSFGTAHKDGKTFETYTSRVSVLQPNISFAQYAVKMRLAGAAQLCENDDAVIVKVCGQVLFNSSTSGGLRYVNIYQANNSAQSNDTTSVRNELRWRVFQSGACLSGCTGTPMTENYGSKTSPGNTINYPQTTNFGSKYQRVSDNPFDKAGVNTTLNYSFRGTRYNVTTYARIPAL